MFNLQRGEQGRFVRSSEEPAGPEPVAAAVGTNVPTGDGARDTLRHAIDRAGACEAHVAALKSSIERLRDELYASEGQLAAAKEASAEAERERIRSFANGDVGALLRFDPLAEVEIEKKIAAIRSAVTMVRNELAEALNSREYVERAVARAAARIFEVEALPDLLAGFERLRDQMEDRRAVLLWLRSRIDSDVGRKIDRVLMPTEPGPRKEAVEPWRISWENLMQTSDGGLPES
jgi:chromosome segregation ATPase